MEDKIKEIALKKSKKTKNKKKNERISISYWIRQGPQSNYKEI